MVEKDNMCIYWAGFFGHELDIQKRARKEDVRDTYCKVRVSHHLLLTAREKGKGERQFESNDVSIGSSG